MTNEFENVFYSIMCSDEYLKNQVRSLDSLVEETGIECADEDFMTACLYGSVGIAKYIYYTYKISSTCIPIIYKGCLNKYFLDSEYNCDILKFLYELDNTLDLKKEYLGTTLIREALIREDFCFMRWLTKHDKTVLDQLNLSKINPQTIKLFLKQHII